MKNIFRILGLSIALLVLCSAAFAQAKPAAKTAPAGKPAAPAAAAPKLVYSLQPGESVAQDRMAPLLHGLTNGRFLVGLQKGEELYALVGGQRSGPFKKLAVGSADGNGLGYFSQKPDGGAYVTVNDKDFGPYKKAEGSCIVNAAGYLFTVQKADDSWYVVVNGKELGPYASCPGAVEPDKAGIAYIAQKADKQWYVFAADKEFGPYAKCSELAFGQAGLAYAAQKADGKWYAVVKGKELGPYEGVSDIQLDRAGYGYFVQKADKKLYAVVYGKEYGPFDNPTELRMNQGAYGFGVRRADDTMFLQINGRRYGEADKFDFMSVMALSKAGYAYEIAKSPYAVVVNGKEYAGFSDNCMSLRVRLLDSGAWFFSQVFRENDRSEAYGIRFSDGTVVRDALAGGQLITRGGKSYCGWFTQKDKDIFYQEKELK